jgi:protein-S-isoprenylcysteine O-methyltransferase Ste14
MDNFLKIYLPVFFLMYLTAAFILPSYRTWKQTGINPVTFGREDTAHNYIGFVMKLLILLLFAVIMVYSFSSTVYQYLLPAYYLQIDAVSITGFVLIHASLLWIMVAQYQMSNSWRIGIDEINKTELVTKGVFGISRNPIFLGMMVTVWGLFLILPNALSFFIAMATYFIIHIQIRLEEEFLKRQHGNHYIGYCKKVRRLL